MYYYEFIFLLIISLLSNFAADNQLLFHLNQKSMKKKRLFLVMMLTMFMLSLSNAYAARVPLTYDDPTSNQGDPHRSPVQVPEVDLSGYTLTFFDSCMGCTLRIVNAEDEVEYTTIITSDTLVLPSTLVGQYELQIIRDNLCFYGDIEL